METTAPEIQIRARRPCRYCPVMVIVVEPDGRELEVGDARRTLEEVIKRAARDELIEHECPNKPPVRVPSTIAPAATTETPASPHGDMRALADAKMAEMRAAQGPVVPLAHLTEAQQTIASLRAEVDALSRHGAALDAELSAIMQERDELRADIDRIHESMAAASEAAAAAALAGPDGEKPAKATGRRTVGEARKA